MLHINVNDTTVVGVGDHVQKKEAERLAALSALYQLDGQELVGYIVHTA